MDGTVIGNARAEGGTARQAGQPAFLAGASALFAGAAMMLDGGILSWAIYAASVTLFLVGLGYAIYLRHLKVLEESSDAVLKGFIAQDAAPSFVTDDEGKILSQNEASSSRFSDVESETLAGTLRAVFANPSAVLYRLQTRAAGKGSAREDIVTRRGHVRIAVHGLTDARFLWRLEDMPERGQAGRNVDTLPVPMFSAGRSGAILYMNEAARRLVGERIKSLDRLFPALPLRSGELNPITTADGPAYGFVVEHESTAGRREIYVLPSAAEAPTDTWGVFEMLPVALLKLDPSGEILTANRMAKTLLGAEFTAGQGLGDVMEGLGRSINDWLRETAQGRNGQKSEFLRLTRPDREMFVQVTLNKLGRDGDEALMAVLSDATELKTLEAQFVQSQKMQAIGQLAGGVAHDFNNLLTAISGHCDLLLLRHDQGDADYADLVQINQNANRAAALVGQLLAFSRKQTLRPEVLDMRDTLSDLTHLLNRLVGEKVTLTLTHDPVLGAIRADKRQLEQVLMNLVVNARDAMPNGGEIRIETEGVTLSRALERDRAVVPAGDYVTVKVQDQGMGIAADKLQKVFEPFFTTKRTGEGTGLGLSTAYGIVKQTGGYIFVDSALGAGTCFTLYFPIHDAVPEAVPAPETATRTSLPQRAEGVVLLVEDEAPVRAFASRALRLRGYTVIEEESAEDALKTLEDGSLNVDVFVTDVVMPGMDGPSWVRKALETRPNTRVVFVSGYTEGTFGEVQTKIPNSVFLPKPFSLSQLTETVHNQLH
ncbi:hybrid sensor histidine kinase/response regulator [Thalassococcus sp. S3]|nr:ATP-binding protein [Thalassococcus sp. S3]QBF31790.1 hybrid sensor histidine kinase/response regulator [Thalassococcus sp. S3]